MTKKDKIIKTLREHRNYLSEHYGVSRIALFGSYAKGNATRKSDVDLLVEFSRPIGLAFVDLAEYVETVLGIKADIITRAGLNGIRVKEIAGSIDEALVYV